MEGVRGNSAWTSPGTLVVGLKLTPESREMLTWIVAKLTQPGDQVIGVHVLHSSTDADFSGEELDQTTKQQLDNTFEAVLGVYQGLCTLKQLDIKVVAGITLREGLVEAARTEKASKLILGSGGRQTIRFIWTHSFANYCVKRLPASCSVMVIGRGKVILEKSGTYGSSGKHLAGAVLRRSMRRLTRTKSPVAKAAMSFSERTQNDSMCRSSSLHSNDIHPFDSDGANASISMSSAENLSPGSPVSVLCSTTNEESYQACISDEKAGSFSERTKKTDFQTKDSNVDQEADSVDHGHQTGNSENLPPCGWPLMHRAISLEKALSSYSEARRLSVVKWALQLPDRPMLPLHSFPKSEDEHAPETSLILHNGLTEVVSNHTSTIFVDQEYTDKPDALQESIAVDVAEVSAMKNLSEEDKKGKRTLKFHEADLLNQGFLELAHKLDTLCLNSSCSRYSYEELEEATSHFSPKNLVGQGGCSQVYQGVLQDGQRVAVKCLNEGSLDAEHELLTEVEILSTLRHRNIIALLGFYVDIRRRLLVYNLAHEGNLDDNLHGGGDRSMLEWSARYKIAVGAARALEYLHDGCPRPVVHRDIKSSNILLTSNFEAQVSDFGLAKWAPDSSSYITCTDVVGTFGYLAPEYFMFGKVNEKTDVYSFGVVLLELITGKQPIDISKPKGQENLVLWARALLERGQFEELVDPRLKKNYNGKQLKHMIVSASLCIRQSPRSRPCMSQVLKFLSGENDYGVPAATQGHLTIKGKEDECLSEEFLGDNGHCDLKSHLALAFLGVDDDDATSQSSTDQSCIDLTALNSSKNLEEYFSKRYSRSSSFE
ncbi:hypothetical protein O6H91_08G065100 [Diphasiastrum complanatum]|uniref:Uncharacterized protein n=1 Tax=Diphasiastrum complanatum TaxID=34168 RepID=A0ACC2CYJ1_DIPCM|nr:hypothetical protein O6H91_08G065100 [Diphasiastrum complanatum]